MEKQLPGRLWVHPGAKSPRWTIIGAAVPQEQTHGPSQPPDSISSDFPHLCSLAALSLFSPACFQCFLQQLLFIIVCFSPRLCCYLFQPRALSLEMRSLGFALACRVHHPAEGGCASVWHLLIIAAPQSCFCFSRFLVQNYPLKITER